jgi:hypothetical protein
LQGSIQGESLQLVGGTRPGSSWSLLLNVLPKPGGCGPVRYWNARHPNPCTSRGELWHGRAGLLGRATASSSATIFCLSVMTTAHRETACRCLKTPVNGVPRHITQWAPRDSNRARGLIIKPFAQIGRSGGAFWSCLPGSDNAPPTPPDDVAEDELAGHQVFPAPVADALRDPNNTLKMTGPSLRRAGFEGATSHYLRRTVATLMDEAGLSARSAADQLGHAKPSLTADMYMAAESARDWGSRSARRSFPVLAGRRSLSTSLGIRWTETKGRRSSNSRGR